MDVAGVADAVFASLRSNVAGPAPLPVRPPRIVARHAEVVGGGRVPPRRAAAAISHPGGPAARARRLSWCRSASGSVADPLPPAALPRGWQATAGYLPTDQAGKWNRRVSRADRSSVVAVRSNQ